MAILLRFVILVALLGVGVVVGAGFYLDSIVKSGLETVGPNITGTSVSVHDVDISAFNGQGHIRGVVVGNPGGFDTESAFVLTDTKIKVDLASVTSGKLVIEEIIIDRPEITYEVHLSGNNLEKIQENIEAFSRSHGLTGSNGSEGRRADSEYTMVQINDLIIKNGTIHVSTSVLGGTGPTLDMDDVHLRDIGKRGKGITIDRATSQILSATRKPVAKTVSKSSNTMKRGVTRVVSDLKTSAEQNSSDTLKKLAALLVGLPAKVKEFFAK